MSDPHKLDITDWTERDGRKLGDKIVSEVQGSQQYVLRPYPTTLRLTFEQYNILSGRRPDADFERDAVFFNTKVTFRGVPLDIAMELEIEGDEQTDKSNLLLTL